MRRFHGPIQPPPFTAVWDRRGRSVIRAGTAGRGAGLAGCSRNTAGDDSGQLGGRAGGAGEEFAGSVSRVGNSGALPASRQLFQEAGGVGTSVGNRAALLGVGTGGSGEVNGWSAGVAGCFRAAEGRDGGLPRQRQVVSAERGRIEVRFPPTTGRTAGRRLLAPTSAAGPGPASRMGDKSP